MIVTAEALSRASRRALEKVGASPGNASEVADHLVLANLSGVDTHGVIHIPQYIDEIRQGWIDPIAEPTVLQGDYAVRVNAAEIRQHQVVRDLTCVPGR